jgi:hypothetical protein
MDILFILLINRVRSKKQAREPGAEGGLFAGDRVIDIDIDI